MKKSCDEGCTLLGHKNPSMSLMHRYDDAAMALISQLHIRSKFLKLRDMREKR